MMIRAYVTAVAHTKPNDHRCLAATASAQRAKSVGINTMSPNLASTIRVSSLAKAGDEYDTELRGPGQTLLQAGVSRSGIAGWGQMEGARREGLRSANVQALAREKAETGPERTDFGAPNLGAGASRSELGLEEPVTLLENLMPSGGQRARPEINDAEPDHILDGRVSSRKMKIVQIQIVAAERNRDGAL